MSIRAQDVGTQIFDIVTSGMYSDPRMAIREYVQNASDAIDIAISNRQISRADSKIDIAIDIAQRSITITDNGSGMSRESATYLLGSLAISSKTSGNSRGFRGIGRLGGLGYCERLEFETRSSSINPIVLITWDISKAYCDTSNKHDSVSGLLSKIVRHEELPATRSKPPRYFKVTMRNVKRFSDDCLMNIPNMCSYLEQVAPIPLNNERFSFSDKVNDHLFGFPGYSTYNVFLNGKKLWKPYADDFIARGKSHDQISGIETISLYDNNKKEIGKGWYSRTSFLASIPATSGISGIRVRQGNIEVGGPAFLAPFFKEPRFALWHSGEIHLDYSVRLNARRDDFEISPNYERIIEQLRALAAHLSFLIRKASKDRYQISKEQSLLPDIARFLEYEHFYPPQTRQNIATKLLNILKSEDLPLGLIQKKTQDDFIRALLVATEGNSELQDLLDGRTLSHKQPKEIINEMVTNMFEPNVNEDIRLTLIKAAIEPYLRK